MSDLDKEYEASLKSLETENKIDRVFYRPIGFVIARMLKGTGITPNMDISRYTCRIKCNHHLVYSKGYSIYSIRNQRTG